jgi:hypothetical protein
MTTTPAWPIGASLRHKRTGSVGRLVHVFPSAQHEVSVIGWTYVVDIPHCNGTVRRTGQEADFEVGAQ